MGQRAHNFISTYLMLVISMAAFVTIIHCTLIQVNDFHSQSFIPKALEISYRIENNVSLYYNVTLLTQFPGKILFNVFVRKVGSQRDEDTESMLKYKNLDFCKTLELLKNFTTDNLHNEMVPQTTFINSCPLTRGFYYIRNASVDDEVVPLYFTSGEYWLQFELVQVFDEVNKLVNVKAKCSYESHL